MRQHKHAHRTRNKRRSLFFTRGPANVAGLSGRTPAAAAADLKMGANNMSVVSTSDRPTDQPRFLMSKQRERERGAQRGGDDNKERQREYDMFVLNARPFSPLFAPSSCLDGQLAVLR